MSVTTLSRSVLGDPFASLGAAESGIPRSAFVECGVCGYEPAEHVADSARPCPKCHAREWRQLYRPEHRAVGNRLAAGFTGPRPKGMPRGTNVMREAKRVYLPKPASRPPRFREALSVISGRRRATPFLDVTNDSPFTTPAVSA